MPPSPKLMTAMVVLDAKMDLEESITIASEDVDTIRHSRSRLPVNTRFKREDALLLALTGFREPRRHALGRTIRSVSVFRCRHECQGSVTGTHREQDRDPPVFIVATSPCQRLDTDGGRSLSISPYPRIYHP